MRWRRHGQRSVADGTLCSKAEEQWCKIRVRESHERFLQCLTTAPSLITGRDREGIANFVKLLKMSKTC